MLPNVTDIAPVYNSNGYDVLQHDCDPINAPSRNMDNLIVPIVAVVLGNFILFNYNRYNAIGGVSNGMKVMIFLVPAV